MSQSPPPITAIDTSVAAFAGHVPGATDEPGTIHRLSSWADFDRLASLSPQSGRSWNDLAHAVHGFFLNGGKACFVVENGGRDERGLAAALAALDGVEANIVAAPGHTSPAAYAALVAHCEARRDRLAILDGPAHPDDAHLKVMSGAAGEAPDGWRMPPPSGFATLYTPWLRVADPEGPDGAMVVVPPAGHITGIWAANDGQRGVWKSPAGLPVVGVAGPSRAITEAEQSAINPRGVNALRAFPGRGLLVWGARTLSADPEWRYIAARRLATMVTGSIGRSTGWVAFEPNDTPLWISLRGAIDNFLTGLWRAGALAGVKPEQAFFVHCGLNQTMTQADIDAGRVLVEVGLAVARPAEFTLLRLSWSPAGFQGG